MIVHSNGYTFRLTYSDGHYRATCCRTGREKVRHDSRVWYTMILLDDETYDAVRVLDAGLIADLEDGVRRLQSQMSRTPKAPRRLGQRYDAPVGRRTHKTAREPKGRAE